MVALAIQWHNSSFFILSSSFFFLCVFTRILWNWWHNSVWDSYVGNSMICFTHYLRPLLHSNGCSKVASSYTPVMEDFAHLMASLDVLCAFAVVSLDTARPMQFWVNNSSLDFFHLPFPFPFWIAMLENTRLLGADTSILITRFLDRSMLRFKRDAKHQS